jgi:hypothetical protein
VQVVEEERALVHPPDAAAQAAQLPPELVHTHHQDDRVGDCERVVVRHADGQQHRDEHDQHRAAGGGHRPAHSDGRDPPQPVEHSLVDVLVALCEEGLCVQGPQLARREAVAHEVDQVPALSFQRRQRHLGGEQVAAVAARHEPHRDVREQADGRDQRLEEQEDDHQAHEARTGADDVDEAAHHLPRSPGRVLDRAPDVIVELGIVERRDGHGGGDIEHLALHPPGEGLAQDLRARAGHGTAHRHDERQHP